MSMQDAQRRDSEAWLRTFAARWNFDYDTMIYEASQASITEWDTFITAYGIDLHSAEELGDDHDLFWSHLERLTGREFDVAHRTRFGWSCSC